MRNIAILLGLLAMPTLSGSAPPGWVSPTYSKQGSLEVQVLSSGGQELPGAVVFLCPMEEAERWDPPSLPLTVEECPVEIADAQGLARFKGIQRASYWAVVQLDGFARTVLYPLPIGDKAPIAPDRILVVLNGLCWGC